MRRISDGWNRWGVRKQLTAVAVVLVAVPLVLGIFVLANLLARSLSTSLVSSATETANLAAAHVAENGTTTLPGDLEIADGYRLQLIDPAGRVVWTSNAKYRTPIAQLHPSAGQVLVENATTWWGPGDNDDQDLLVAQGVTSGHQTYTVLAATSQRPIHDAVTIATGLLLAAVPLVMLATGLISWWVAGRALRPVDEMIDRVGRITSSTLDDRLPLPIAEDELQALAITMNQMLGRLETAHDSQQRFVSDASHELRSPLASLSGALEIARHDDTIGTWREMAPLMGNETDRMTHLVQGLLTLSRGEAAGLTMHLAETDLDDLVFEEASRLRTASPSLGVHTRVAPARVDADPMKLRQVLRNLCDNAARHARAEVLLVLQPQDGTAVLRVEDDGNGIAPADRERVFERFVRLQESRSRDEGGSGLGLAIVTQIVQAHGGTVRVVDSALGGACFEVRLPLARD